jgi:hypothetical protein
MHIRRLLGHEVKGHMPGLLRKVFPKTTHVPSSEAPIGGGFKPFLGFFKVRRLDVPGDAGTDGPTVTIAHVGVDKAPLRHTGKQPDPGTTPNSESPSISDIDEANKSDTHVSWVAEIVMKLLEGRQYRLGGSYAAQQLFGAPRVPKDLDLEFWTFEEARSASEVLVKYNAAEDESKPYPQLSYFVRTIDENMGVTMTAMGFTAKGERPTPLLTIELSNENHRQGTRDFKKRPETRHDAQPPSMRRASLIAGSLQRFSFTRLLNEADRKQDEAQLKHLIRQELENRPPREIYEDVMSRFDRDMIKNPPPAEDSESDDSQPIDHDARMKVLDAELKKFLGLD